MGFEQLENLVRVGELAPERPAADEVAGLLHSGGEYLAAAKSDNLLSLPRFSLAYNAAYAFSLATLRLAGYRTAKRYIVFQCLQHILNLPDKRWRMLAEAHKRRNLVEYQGDANVEERFVQGLIQTVDEVAVQVSQYQAQVMPDTNPIVKR